jgi:hypothetical protein
MTDTQRYILARLSQRGWKIKHIESRYWLADTRGTQRRQIYNRTFWALRDSGLIVGISDGYVITEAGRSFAPASPRWMP